MGLYQYIREQQHRHDLVGELGKWMSNHYPARPDHNSRAFEIASKEFAACGNWTRQEALKKVNQDKEFQRILKIEPRLSPIISEVIKVRATKGYDRIKGYSHFKDRINNLVGFSAEKVEIADSDSHSKVIKVISNLLPPDMSDLYPDGTSEDENLDLDL